MQSFEEYVENRETLDEGPLSWLKNKLWGQEPQKAARAVGPMLRPRSARLDLTPAQRMQGQQAYQQARMTPPPMPQARPSARLDLTPAQRMQGQQAYQQARQQSSAQPERVKFTRQYLNDIASTAENYLKIVGRFAASIRDRTNDPMAQQALAKSFADTVLPAYKNLGDWAKWARAKASEVPQREWAEEHEFLEAIKVNYGKFENIQRSIQDINFAMRRWMNNLGSAVPQLGPYVNRFQREYDAHIVANPITQNLARKFASMGGKIEQLMSIHGKDYQGVGQRTDMSKPGASPPPFSQDPYGARLAGQMHQGQQAAQSAKTAGMGVSAMSRGQPGVAPMVPVGKRQGSMLNRGV